LAQDTAEGTGVIPAGKLNVVNAGWMFSSQALSSLPPELEHLDWLLHIERTNN